MRVRCTAFCRRYWTLSACTHIPPSGYVCPQCQAELNRIAREKGERVAPAPVRQYKERGKIVCAGGAS
jgi:uncharacterized protein with PIN domain